MTNKEKNKENVEKLPLTKNWPFSFNLARAFIIANKSGSYLSFKDFLIRTWLEYDKGNSENSEEFENNSDLDDYLSSETAKSWPNLYYPGFFY